MRRAISLVYKDLARIVSTEDYSTYSFEDWLKTNGNGGHRSIRTVNFEFRVPEVIVLTLYGGIPRKDTVLTRKAIFERDNNTCQYCGKKKRKDKLTIDHVIPLSKGGAHGPENIVTACRPCNSRKWNHLPAD